MKTGRTFILTLLLLIICSLHATAQTDYFYYYGSQKIPLYLNEDKVVVSYAKEVEKIVKTGSGTRGAVGGPRYGESRVYGKTHTDYEIKFWANELAEVIVIGDGDNDLDLYIYDQNGNLVASDTDYTDQCVCRWVPAWTGSFRIRIVNRGAIYSDFAIATN